MFVSKRRPVVFPQSEHARLAGTIAQYWGNEQFQRPEMPFDAFCAGVALHDFGYGLLDTDNIVSMELSERQRTFESLMGMRFDDPVVEIVAKTHVARLMNTSGFASLEARCRQQLKELIAGTDLPADVFTNADTITRLCDSIAFDFCFEQDAGGSVAVAAEQTSAERVEVCYQIDFDSNELGVKCNNSVGCIRLSPWPLSADIVRGYLLAYEQSGFPEELNPCRVEFEIRS
ncbi:MAG: DUF3891 family protein [Granulosicoccus sp.]|nr:DUF3891 family protein [Granulosicoccus sp.]